ncbi:MAG: hypothetical protein OQK51_24750 [Kangiellaceae bacterium]|nr:hypothetical protein [Kangiellaceae bacterium]
MKSKLLGVAIFLLITGCGANTHYFNQSYKQESFKNKNIGVLLLDKDQVTVFLRDHYMDDFENVKDSEIDQHAADLLNEINIKTLTNSISSKQSNLIKISPKDFNSENSETFTQDLSKISKSKGVVKFKVPNTQLIRKTYPNIDFLLIMSNVTFGYETSLSNPSSQGNPHVAGITHRALQLRYDYLLKDMASDESVNIGIASAIASANYYIEKGDWLKIMKDSIEQLVEQTPLNK